jgi:hypothetical protein
MFTQAACYKYVDVTGRYTFEVAQATEDASAWVEGEGGELVELGPAEGMYGHIDYVATFRYNTTVNNIYVTIGSLIAGMGAIYVLSSVVSGRGIGNESGLTVILTTGLVAPIFCGYGLMTPGNHELISVRAVCPSPFFHGARCENMLKEPKTYYESEPEPIEEFFHYVPKLYLTFRAEGYESQRILVNEHLMLFVRLKERAEPTPEPSDTQEDATTHPDKDAHGH